MQSVFKDEINNNKNLQFYPKAPKMNNLKIISLSCCMEALEIDSENLFCSKLKTEYTKLFPSLIDRSNFNRRRRRLSASINKVQELIYLNLLNLSQVMVLNSMAVPVIKLAREKTFKYFKEDFDTAPAKGYSAVNKS